ncbi:hypothetical protein BCR34DRAFT_73824 [Clohesyomyces aquaticus]|uniref:Uncharacterized protein n=1 Tax=Clohesyomyces aquaticus TaxID=1231657 RepID=A0A1Y2A311_9PLEO|nr:hypothetical protein BCR34DRAFT_73824 [Clohesyomyces aquaticus]
MEELRRAFTPLLDRNAIERHWETLPENECVRHFEKLQADYDDLQRKNAESKRRTAALEKRVADLYRRLAAGLKAKKDRLVQEYEEVMDGMTEDRAARFHVHITYLEKFAILDEEIAKLVEKFGLKD